MSRLGTIDRPSFEDHYTGHARDGLVGRGYFVGLLTDIRTSQLYKAGQETQ